MSSTIKGTNPTDAQLVALAEKLGWTVKEDHGTTWIFRGSFGYPLEHLCTWPGAGAVVEAMMALGYDYSMAGPDLHEATFGNLLLSLTALTVESATLPDAILLAACAALEVK